MMLLSVDAFDLEILFYFGCQGVVGLSVLGQAHYCLISGSCGTQCIGTSSLLFDVKELWDSVYWNQLSIV